MKKNMHSCLSRQASGSDERDWYLIDGDARFVDFGLLVRGIIGRFRLPIAAVVIGLISITALPVQANRPKTATFSVYLFDKPNALDAGDIWGIRNPMYWRLQDMYLYAGYKTPAKGGGTLNIQVLDRTAGQLNMLQDAPGGRYRYKLRLSKLPAYMTDFAWKTGYLVVTWDKIRPYIWDKLRQKSLAGEPWTYLSPEQQKRDDCFYDCKPEACDPDTPNLQRCLENYDP